MIKGLTSIFFLLIAASLSAKKNDGDESVPQGLEKIDGPYGRPKNLLLPENFDPGRRYWLYVMAHEAGGTGVVAARGKNFPYRDQCIFVGPSFPHDQSQGFYQELGGSSDKQLDKIVEDLRVKYKLHDRFMLQGHSGGSQFSHRYAMKNHKLVLACISSSGGTWSDPGASAKYLPFLFSCGEKDTQISGSASMDRLSFYRKFRDAMVKGKFFYSTQVVPGEGHSATGFVNEGKGDLFLLVTTGLWPCQRAELEAKISEIRRIISARDNDNAAAAIKRLSFFRPSAKLKYEEKPVDDTDEKERRKTHMVNEYGYTSNPNAEKYLSERLKYYLNEILVPALTAELEAVKKK